MSIIYSYPTSQPTVDDLLIGTDVADDNATKSFTVQSLVSLINAEAGSGTLTSVTISTDAFLTAIGNPTGPAVAYTIGLAATGTPSATTFLRGDNQWVTPTVTSGIGVYSSNVLVTNDLSSVNFTGAGVSTVSDVSGNVTVTIEGLASVVETIVAGNGIGISGPTGNVIISNTGITGLINGNGISISTTAAGLSTISVIGQTIGTVTSAAPGPGLSLISGTTTVNPVIGLDYTGADTYITQPVAAVPLAADLIPFHSIAGDTVNKVTFGDIQASTLTLVDTAISNADANNVKNNTDLLPSVNKVLNVITLTDQEYLELSTTYNPPGAGYVAGTLYLTTATGQPQNTVNFTINTSAINATGSCGFTQSTTVNGSVVNPIAVTGSVGSQYTVATTITPTGSNCSISGGSATQTITGTIPATPTPAAVTQTLAARTISAPAAPGTVTDALTIVDGIGDGTGYTITSNSPLSGTQGDSFSTSGFGLTATPISPYVFTSGPSVSYNYTTSYYGDNNTVGTISGNVSIATYPVTYSVDVSGITDNSGNGYALNVTDSFSGTAQGNPGITVSSGSEVTATVTAVPTNGTLPGGAISDSVTVSSVTSAQNISLTLTGTIGANTGNASMTLANNGINGPANGYTVSYTADGSPYTIGSAVSGTVGTSVTFNTILTVNNNYTATTALSASYTNGTLVPIGQTTAVTLAGTVVADRGQGVYNSTDHVSSNEACQEGNPQETVYLSVGGSTIYAGVTLYTSATGSGTVAAGYYKANNNTSWIRVTSNPPGYVSSTGSC